MKELLKNLKLVEDFSTELSIQKTDFVSKFKQQVEEDDFGFFSDTTDLFCSSKKEYRGQINNSKFKIRKRRKLFDFYPNRSVAKGTFLQQGDALLISTEVSGFSGKMIPFYIFCILFYIVSFNFLFLRDTGMELVFLAVILFHAVMMLGLPYVYMRRGVQKMRRELEREFFFLTK